MARGRLRFPVSSTPARGFQPHVRSCLRFQLTLRLLPNRPQPIRSQAQLQIRLKSSSQAPPAIRPVGSKAAQRAAAAGNSDVIGWPADIPANRLRPLLVPLHSTELRFTSVRRLHPPPPPKADSAIASAQPERFHYLRTAGSASRRPGRPPETSERLPPGATQAGKSAAATPSIQRTPNRAPRRRWLARRPKSGRGGGRRTYPTRIEQELRRSQAPQGSPTAVPITPWLLPNRPQPIRLPGSATVHGSISAPRPHVQ